MPSEADTCRELVVPLLQAAGWDSEYHTIAEQRTIMDGCMVAVGKGFIRKAKRNDYLVRYRDERHRHGQARQVQRRVPDSVPRSD